MSKELLQAGLQGLAKTAADIYRGFADLQEAKANNGISTKVRRETSTTAGPETTTTETNTNNVETVNHTQRAKYLRDVVAARIENSVSDLTNQGIIRIGNQVINVSEVIAYAGLIAASLSGGFGKAPAAGSNGEGPSAPTDTTIDLNELLKQLQTASTLAASEDLPASAPTGEEPSASVTSSEKTGTLPQSAEEAPTASKTRKRRNPKVEG